MLQHIVHIGSGLELFQRILVFKDLADIAQQVKMVVADTGNAEHEVGFFIAEVHALRILQQDNAGLFNGALLLAGAVGNGYAHAHVGAHQLFALHHGIGVTVIHIAPLCQQRTGGTDGGFHGFFYGFIQHRKALGLAGKGFHLSRELCGIILCKAGVRNASALCDMGGDVDARTVQCAQHNGTARHKGGRHPAGEVPAAARILKAVVLGVGGVVCMAGAQKVCGLGVIAAAGVGIFDHQGNGGAGGAAVHHAGQQLHGICLHPGSGQAVAPGTALIHAGGEDLIFPHHENEIAQSECANGKTFANYWMHNAFLNIDNRKMSKSLGNFFTVREISEKYDLQVLRLFMLSAQYRSPLNFSADLMEASKNSLERIRTAAEHQADCLKAAKEGEMTAEEKQNQAAVEELVQKFETAMDDDFNTADAISAIFEIVRLSNSTISEASTKAYVSYVKETMDKLCDVLGIITEKKEEILDSEVEDLIAKRQQARKEKNFALADKIRDDLKARGIVLLDTPQGVKWKMEQ